MITLNNQPYEWREGLTVGDLMREKNFVFRHIIVAVNGAIVPESQYATHVVADGDMVRIEHIFGGG